MGKLKSIAKIDNCLMLSEECRCEARRQFVAELRRFAPALIQNRLESLRNRLFLRWTLFIFFGILFITPMVHAQKSCQAYEGRDQVDEVFAFKLRMLQQRQKDYRSYLAQRRAAEKKINAGIAPYKKAKEQEQRRLVKQQREEDMLRRGYLLKRRKEFTRAWQIYHKKKLEQEWRRECVRMAYIHKREQFLREAAKINQVPEAVDAGLKSSF